MKNNCQKQTLQEFLANLGPVSAVRFYIFTFLHSGMGRWKTGSQKIWTFILRNM